MKYLLPLVLLASAAWAAGSDPHGASAPRVDPAGERRAAAEVPWLNPALAAQVAAVLDSDPHSAVHGADPHEGSAGGAGDACPHLASDGAAAVEWTRDDPHAGSAQHDGPHDDPHAGTRAPAGAQLPARAIPRSSARNGHTIAELYARRDALAEQAVSVRGVVVKRTDGILGQSYLHVQDGTGSAAAQDHDLTVTTTEDVALGETVELQGLVRVDQDLGLGYRYALMLTGATRSEVR